MSTITFTIPASGGGSDTTLVMTPVNGSLKVGGGSDDRGGGKLPSVRAGLAQNGSCDVVIVSATAANKQQSLAEVKSLVSPVGKGDRTVAGTTPDGVDFKSVDALIDVEINGDSVQTATISWKGTYEEPAQQSSGTGE